MYSLTLVIPPTDLPVSLAEAKKQVEVAGGITYHDDHLQRLIKAATQMMIVRSGRVPLTATYDYRIDRFPAGSARIDLPIGPLQSVTSIAYMDSAGVWQTLSASVYKVLTAQAVPQIALKYGQCWPSTYVEAEAVTVRIVVGFADLAEEFADAEEYLKAGILLVVQAFWMRDHSQPYEKLLAAAETIFEQYRVGDDFVEFAHDLTRG